MLTQHTCSVSRTKVVGTNGKSAMSVIATNVPCTFIPMSAQAAISQDFSVGFGWDIYFNSGTDVRSGDRLTWNGRTFMVSGSMPYEGFPGVEHLHVTAKTEKSNGQ